MLLGQYPYKDRTHAAAPAKLALCAEPRSRDHLEWSVRAGFLAARGFGGFRLNSGSLVARGGDDSIFGTSLGQLMSRQPQDGSFLPFVLLSAQLDWWVR